MLAKIREETDEIEHALDGGDTRRIASEIGDLLFAVVNLARHANADPEAALRGRTRNSNGVSASLKQQLAAAGRSPAKPRSTKWTPLG